MRALKTEVEIPSILRLPHVRVSVVLFPVLFVVLGVGLTDGIESPVVVLGVGLTDGIESPVVVLGVGLTDEIESPVA